MTSRVSDGSTAVSKMYAIADREHSSPVAELFERVRKMAMYNTAGVDALNRALMLFETKEGNVTETILALRKVSLGSLGHVSWNEEDRKKLADGAQQHHNDIVEIAKLLPNKKMGDVVKRYYVQVGYVALRISPLSRATFSDLGRTLQTHSARRRADSTRRESDRSRRSEQEDGSPKSPRRRRGSRERWRKLGSRVRGSSRQDALAAQEPLLRDLFDDRDAQVVLVPQQRLGTRSQTEPARHVRELRHPVASLCVPPSLS